MFGHSTPKKYIGLSSRDEIRRKNLAADLEIASNQLIHAVGTSSSTPTKYLPQHCTGQMGGKVAQSTRAVRQLGPCPGT